MTDEELAAIRERMEAATPGPWHVEGAALVVKHVPVEQGRINHIMTDAQYAGGCDRTPDAEFVAHAREDIPALLAEVEQRRAREAALLETLEEAYEQWRFGAEAEDQVWRAKARALLASEG